MAIKKFLKLQMNEKNIKLYIDLLTKIKCPFTLETSNYTTKIISDTYNVYFLKGIQSNQTFAAAAKIKSDLKNTEIPVIDMARNCYFDTGFKGEGFYSDRVYNIDIKNAYPSILYNAGFIKLSTYEYLNKLPKKNKLAALGMLASKKDIFHHSKTGEVFKMEERISPLSNFFFYCVQETENIIQSCKNQILMDSFLFSWVDGIYYLNHNDNYRSITQNHLKKDFNLDSSFQVLTDFEVQLKKEHYKINFIDAKQKNKIFNIPLPQTKLKKEIIHYLLTKKYDK